MPYKFSERHLQDAISAKNNDPNRLDLAKVGTVFILFGLLSLVTAWFYSMETEQVLNTSFKPSGNGAVVEVGPLTVQKNNEIYGIHVQADLSAQSWSQIEGEVLDAEKEYLFSFGKELTYYSGRDEDGTWTEIDDTYTMNVTFPQAGTYYLSFESESSTIPDSIVVRISQKRGSSLPHLWFGIATLITGLVLNEIRNRTIQTFVENMNSD